MNKLFTHMKLHFLLMRSAIFASVLPSFLSMILALLAALSLKYGNLKIIADEDLPLLVDCTKLVFISVPTLTLANLPMASPATLMKYKGAPAKLYRSLPISPMTLALSRFLPTAILGVLSFIIAATFSGVVSRVLLGEVSVTVIKCILLFTTVLFLYAGISLATTAFFEKNYEMSSLFGLGILILPVLPKILTSLYRNILAPAAEIPELPDNLLSAIGSWVDGVMWIIPICILEALFFGIFIQYLIYRRRN